MAAPHHPVTRSTSRGFSLVEVLVALSLITILGGSAFLLLRSTQKIYNQIIQPLPEQTLQELGDHLRRDLDNWIPHPSPPELPDLQLEAGIHLTLTSREPAGGRAQKVQYTLQPGEVVRTARRYLDSTTVTNRFEVSRVSLHLRQDGAWIPDWPPEESADPARPSMLRMIWEGNSTPQHHDLLIPASLRVTVDNAPDA